MFSFIDWGTSNFRALLLDDDFNEIDSIATSDGMLSLQKEEFHPYIKKTLAKWLEKDIKIYMSGMVGSQNGWLETKYVLCDVSLNDLAQGLVKIPNIEENIYIVPGVKSEKDSSIDLMRGEEVQIFGAMEKMKMNNGIFILPGTHSKWVEIKDKKIVNFKTNMTGEVFNLMSTSSILEKSIKSTDLNNIAFNKGAELSLSDGGILNHMFQARAQANNIGDDGVYSFLSAIVIGAEIKQMNAIFNPKEVVIIGTLTLNDLYKNIFLKYNIKTTSIDAKTASNVGMRSICEKTLKA